MGGGKGGVPHCKIKRRIRGVHATIVALYLIFSKLRLHPNAVRRSNGNRRVHPRRYAAIGD